MSDKIVKNLNFGDEAKVKIFEGVNKLTKAVGSTLGPSGQCVILEDSNGKPIITKDGVTVADSITLLDPVENMGATLLKEAARKTVKEAGDELYLGGNDTWQMRLSGGNILMDNGGNLGVGISAPFTKLHVRNSTNEGTIAIGHQSFPGLIHSSASSGEFRIDNRSSFNGYITFYPNGQSTTLGSEAMRITSTGFSYFTNKLTVGHQLAQGNLTMTGEAYQQWAVDSYAWDWVAEQLNLTITGDYAPPVPTTTTSTTTEAPVTTTTSTTTEKPASTTTTTSTTKA